MCKLPSKSLNIKKEEENSCQIYSKYLCKIVNKCFLQIYVKCFFKYLLYA